MVHYSVSIKERSICSTVVQALLHTYLSVAEISEAKIEGFQNVGYVDQVQLFRFPEGNLFR